MGYTQIEMAFLADVPPACAGRERPPAAAEPDRQTALMDAGPQPCVSLHCASNGPGLYLMGGIVLCERHLRDSVRSAMSASPRRAYSSNRAWKEGEFSSPYSPPEGMTRMGYCANVAAGSNSMLMAQARSPAWATKATAPSKNPFSSTSTRIASRTPEGNSGGADCALAAERLSSGSLLPGELIIYCGLKRFSASVVRGR